MSQLVLLRPTARRRVMDLLQEAGADVSDWANYGDGSKPPAANPKYCYEWSFVEPRFVVLNVWFDDLFESDGTVSLSGNLRESAEIYSEPGGKAVWRNRATRFDQAVALAARKQLPIRAIICEGSRRRRDDPEQRASKVKGRVLDPKPWAVQTYDPATGNFVLVRGLSPAVLRDQFDLPELTGPTEVHSKTGVVFARKPEVRRAALIRAQGRCEFCGELGFPLPGGGVFLETHHIVPLSEGGPDTPQNVAAVCPTHHREAHYGANADAIHERLQVIAAQT